MEQVYQWLCVYLLMNGCSVNAGTVAESFGNEAGRKVWGEVIALIHLKLSNYFNLPRIALELSVTRLD